MNVKRNIKRNVKKNYIILAIDTSCDETAAAVTVNDKVLSNVISSQVELHRKYGGVVPSIAKRAHQERIEPVITEALKRALPKIPQSPQFPHILYTIYYILNTGIDAIAVTQGPGLAPALEIGITKAKELVKRHNVPLIAVNHMEGHLLSSFTKNSRGNGPFTKTKPHFPALGLLVSGGHTQLVLMKDFGQHQLVGETLDDAAGEAFDKVAKMLNLGYPGGPIIEAIAKNGNHNKYSLPVPLKDRKTLDFSFSGLKTACLYLIQDLEKKGVKNYHADLAASFQKTASLTLANKLSLAIQKHRPKMVLLGGGVISNLTVRKYLRKTTRAFNLPVFIPYSKKLFTDNAAMIGIAAYYKSLRNEFIKNPATLDRKPNLNFQS